MTTKSLSRSRFFLQFLVGFALFLGFAPLHAQNAEMAPADALVLRVTGDVQIIRAGTPQDAALPLNRREKIGQGDRVITGAPPSSVSLVFSNGSNLTVRPGTSLIFEELAQIPFQAENGATYGSLPAEPSESRSRMRLEQGEVIGEVRGLKGVSVFEVATEVGTAGIRGTIFGVKIERVGSTWRLEITNADGSVRYYSDVLGIAATELEAENAASIEAEYDSETGQFTLSEESQQSLSSDAISAIIDEVEEITEEAESDNSTTGNQEQTDSGDEGDDDEGVISPA
jgi:hypothetical protein